MADNLKYNVYTQNYPFFRLKVEMFGHSTLWTNQWNKSPQSCQANE